MATTALGHLVTSRAPAPLGDGVRRLLGVDGRGALQRQ
jgi:hypothetical protein